VRVRQNERRLYCYFYHAESMFMAIRLDMFGAVQEMYSRSFIPIYILNPIHAALGYEPHVRKKSRIYISLNMPC
jgi:hypothetical protein